ncbi:precorrin-6y C5,15-methyltransferase (decarboxylating) subunit CbiE [Haloprofundus halobius]|uniref:precorrin-6y C5,15-methyltransferase (decarboxylating) subunit CbiE n=1 Tax=Haloprofundus halobius TaxID=2876194 RepID=UPI001CCFBBC7|nr:precorrin-6y C5,15-methyltransferase (decarboxylating) subunit CbiE [Haloprofundus halobius]
MADASESSGERRDEEQRDGTDPGEEAAAAPESGRTERGECAAYVPAVGVGPGDPRYLTERAAELLADADVVVGFDTVLDLVRDRTDAAFVRCSYGDQSVRLAEFAERVADGDRGVAVLWGDPNVSGYQFLGRVERAVDRPVRVVPGVSAVQVAAARARTPLEQSTVVSLHKRGELAVEVDRIAADIGERHLLVIPRPPDWMPERVAAHLLDAGANHEREVLVFECLTFPTESRTTTTLGALAATGEGDERAENGENEGFGGNGDRPPESSFDDLTVLVVRR